MVLYIMRHAEAVVASDDLPDAWRYLTDKGIRSVLNVSKNMARYGRKPRLIISSPLVRAVQTAQIAATHACRRNKLIISGLLQANGDLNELLGILHANAEAKRVMIVGHEPHLGSLAAGLLQKDDTIQLKKGGCIALELDDNESGKPARFLWYMVPGKKTVTSLKKAFAHKS